MNKHCARPTRATTKVAPATQIIALHKIAIESAANRSGGSPNPDPEDCVGFAPSPPCNGGEGAKPTQSSGSGFGDPPDRFAADSMAILWSAIIWVAGATFVVARVGLAQCLLMLLRVRRRPV